MTPVPNLMLETDLMRSFAVIAEFGSFSAAARRVNRTPSAISMQIKKLEEQLGRQLFVRDGRAVRLTADGNMLLDYAHDMLRLNEAAIARFQVPALEGVVRFGAPDDFGTQYIPPILKRFADTHPLVEVEVVLATTRELLKRMDQGSLDLALATSVADSKSSIAETVYVEQLVWIGLKGGKAHRATPIPLALAETGCCWRESALNCLAEAGIEYRIAYVSETAIGNKRLFSLIWLSLQCRFPLQRRNLKFSATSINCPIYRPIRFASMSRPTTSRQARRLLSMCGIVLSPCSRPKTVVDKLLP